MIWNGFFYRKQWRAMLRFVEVENRLVWKENLLNMQNFTIHALCFHSECVTIAMDIDFKSIRYKYRCCARLRKIAHWRLLFQFEIQSNLSCSGKKGLNVLDKNLTTSQLIWVKFSFFSQISLIDQNKAIKYKMICKIFKTFKQIVYNSKVQGLRLPFIHQFVYVSLLQILPMLARTVNKTDYN